MVYRFGAFELDTARVELRQNGDAVPVEPQVFALLALLVANRHRMVSKDEIHEKIWSGRIVSEAALSSRIRSARQAIGDDGARQRMIRTVRSNGFRFIAEVTCEAPEPGPSEPPAPSDSPAVAPEPAGPPPAPAPARPSRPTVAILPFDNMSDDPEQAYFSDAVAADLITNLAKHRWLNVIARNTTFGYKGRSINIRQLADELGADYVVEGSVRHAGDRIRVTANLIDATTGSSRWSERYDRELVDVFEVQDEITAMIAARLEPEIGFAERRKTALSPHRDLHAWSCFHLGVANFFKFTAEGNREAQRLLEKSAELDPNCGEAHAWWAYAVVLGMVYWDTEPDEDLLARALEATSRALEIDDQNAVFYALKARVQLARREYDSAIAENKIAIELNPTFAAAYCGLGDSLAYEGRYEESVASFARAIDLSPNDPQRWAFLTYGALALIFKHAFEEAIAWADRASEIPNCQYWTTAHKAVALAHLNRLKEASHAVARLLAQKPDFTRSFARRKLFYLKRPEQLKLYLQGLEKAGVPT